MNDHQLKDVLPQEAYEILQQDKNAAIVDVRSTMEFQYVGHPIDAIHIPLMEPPHWQPTIDFVVSVQEALFDKSVSAEDCTVLLLCRSGKRSEAAGMALLADGFNNVYNILEGFEGDLDKNAHRSSINGWRFHNLPWEQG